MHGGGWADAVTAPSYEEYCGHRIIATPVSDGAGGFNCDCTIMVNPDQLPLMRAGITGSHPTPEAAYAVGLRNAKSIIDVFGVH